MTSAAKRAVARVDRRQADAVDRDRVARAQLARRARRAIAQAHAVGASASTAATRAELLDEPGEHRSPLPQPRGDEHVLADAARTRASARAAPRRSARRPRPRAGRGRCGRRARAARGTAAARRSRRRRRTRRRGCGPPSSRIEPMPAAPSWSSARATRAGSCSPVATIDLGAGASPARRSRVRGAARETTTVSGTSGAAATSCESSGSRAVESKTTRRGWRATPSMRAVSCGSSASAVPIPTATASHSARQRCASRRLSSPEIHFESPVARGDLAVERHRRLEEDPRAAGAGVLAEGLVEQPRARGELAVGDHRPRRPRRAGSRGRGRTPSRSGRRRRRRRGGCRPRGSRRCTAAACRCGSRARARRRASRRRGRRRRPRERLDLGVRPP